MLVDLNLYNKKVIVIGGGTEGTRKVRGLVGQNSRIIVMSPRLNRYLKDLESRGEIMTIVSKVRDVNILDNYEDVFLVIAATDDKELNRRLVKKGRTMGAFVYAVDDPTVSDFSYASIINIEDVMQIAVSTSGRSPIMARRIRIRAERVLRRLIKKTDIEMAKLQEFARNAAKSKIDTVTERKQFLYSVEGNNDIQILLKENKIEEARIAALDLLNKWSNEHIH
ncbi:MAG TPA: bifunctional precorrin-2 dehydrogenase/sirohydrochlorin ferrochelatase [Nitrososphaeraceae archaeon]